jgi:glutathione S-transferase
VTQHRLLGAEVSLYTGKVRAYLKYKGIPYEEVAATTDVYREVILPRTGVRFIPVLISDDDVAVQDSSAIIDFLEARYPAAGIYPAGPLQRLAALLFEMYGDEWLVVPAMHYRWNLPENRAFAIEEFGRLAAPNATPEEQRAIGARRAEPFAGALPALGIHPENVPAIEASYLAFLRDFDRHLADLPYLFGTRPSIGDFGLFGPLYAHLFRDPASGKLMRAHAPAVASWVERMRDPVPQAGTFLPDDVVPATLEPLLRRAFDEFGPILASTVRSLAAWERPDLPRAIGRHSFALGGVSAPRAIYPFNVWRWQRAYDAYRPLSGDARTRADALMNRIGARPLVELGIPRRLARVDNKLDFEQ